MPGKTNAVGYELYAVVAEANGQALPLAFTFTASTDGTVAEGAKQHMLQSVLKHINKQCPNISVAHSDKDLSEINAIQIELPRAKHQLCYWHAIKYLEEHLAEDKPLARYDPRKAHQVHHFIDPTWAPGITSGLLEEDVHIEGIGSEESESLEEGGAVVSENSKMQMGNRLTLLLDGTC